MLYIIDIGGSSIKVGIMNDNEELIEKHSFTVPQTMKELVEVVCDDFEAYQKSYDFLGLAISAPGSVDIETGIIHGASALPFLHGPNLKQVFGERLQKPVAIENDANCAALAEAYYGQYQQANALGFLVIGSGVGGSLVYKKEIIHGTHLFGGEIGYTIVGEADGKGKTLSERGAFIGLLHRCREHGIDVADGKQLFALADQGNQIAQEEIRQFFRYLAIGIYNLQYIFDPDIILLGGAITSREDILVRLEEHLEAIKAENKDAKLLPKIAFATFKADSNLIGAYANFQQQYNKM